MKKLSGVRLPQRKSTAGKAPERIATPPRVTIPMVTRIGIPAVPVVAVGDKVKVGQLIAEAGGFVSSPVHASISGEVVEISDYLKVNGEYVKAITIESDGLCELYEGLTPPDVHDYESFLTAVSDSGVVGLGGAGFPTAVKLTVKDLSQVEEIVVNGAECEPYITSDTRTMLDHSDLVWDGILMLKKYLKTQRIVVAIENNKPECIKIFEKLCKTTDGVEVAALPHLYPQGGERMLVYHTTGRIIPEGKLPIDAGAIIINCTTLSTIARYIETGMPLVEKCVTVDGSAVKKPGNVIAPIGTPLRALFEHCGGFKEEPCKVTWGGPMMGISVMDLDLPVLKTSNATLAFTAADAKFPETTACIKCGNCVNHCPMQLMPTEIETAYRMKNPERLNRLKVNLCMECGCCSYICPAKRPLVQTNKLAKIMLADWKKQQEHDSQNVSEREEAAVK